MCIRAGDEIHYMCYFCYLFVYNTTFKYNKSVIGWYRETRIEREGWMALATRMCIREGDEI
jgi:hypothetical protein